MTHSIIISSADSSSCNIILSIISSPDFPYNVAGIASDTDALFRLTEEINPSIVIVDCTASENNCYEQIRRLRSFFGFELQIVSMGPRDFTSIYKSIQAGADNYLLVPVQRKELLSVLHTAADTYGKMHNQDTASRRFFLTDNSIDSLRDHPLTTRQLNSTYGTHFIEGLYQMLFIKFDFPNSFESFNSENTPLFLKLSEFITSYFRENCADIIYEVKKDGIMVLLNFEESLKNSVSSRIIEMYDRIAALIRSSYTLDITICVSSVVNSPCKVWEIKKQVRDAEWSRMHYGVNKLIFWTQNSEDIQAAAKKKLQPIMESINFAISSLNIYKFRQAVNEFYVLSPNVLTTHPARIFVRQILSQIFQIYWDTILAFTDPTACYDNLSYCLHLCTSFEQHHRILLGQCVELLKKIDAQSARKYSPAVAQSMNFVKNNIDKPILLEDAAAEVQLSKGYFSFLFKKETGLNFTKYVNDKKNAIACELLKNSNLNISEIAWRIGMSDVRSFSKKFHALNGTTPSNYRKIHHDRETHIL